MLAFILVLFIGIGLLTMSVLAKKRMYLLLPFYALALIIVGSLIPFSGVISSLNFNHAFNEFCGGALIAQTLSAIFFTCIVIFITISGLILAALLVDIFKEFKLFDYSFRLKEIRTFEIKNPVLNSYHVTNHRLLNCKFSC